MNQSHPAAMTHRLAELYVEAVEVVAAFGGRYGDDPEPRSQADTEMHHNETSGPGGPWAPSELYTAFSLAKTVFIGAAGEYLLGLSQLLDQDEMALYAFQVVARPLVESAAHAWWILDPDIGPRQRVGRTSTERWRSVVELGKVEGSGEIDPKIQEKRVLEFRIEMAKLGLDETLNRKSRVIGYEGYPSPDLTTLVGQFLKAVRVAKGEYWYRYMSGISHTALYAYLQYHRWEEIPGQDRATLTPNLPVNAVANIAVLGTASYLGAVERHAQLFGRDAEAVAEERIRIVQAILAAVATPGR
jgi:hypothetical protein